MSKIVFVTGTDTGVGKTLLTALLLCHLRAEGVKALAVKPFCSGGRGDAKLLHSLQAEEVTLDEVNPFHFEKPLAPYLAANQKQRGGLRLERIAEYVLGMSERCDFLLVEGAGGVLVPVGPDWFVRDLIAALDCETILVSRDRLGTINHTLLSVEALREVAEKRGLKIVLMGQRAPDLSEKTNRKFLGQTLAGTVVVSVGFQGAGASRPRAIKANGKSLKKVLAQLVV